MSAKTEKAVVRAAMRFHIAYINATVDQIMRPGKIHDAANRFHNACARHTAAMKKGKRK